MIIEYFEDGFHVTATLGTFIESVFVEKIMVQDKYDGTDMTEELDPETLSELKDLAIVKYKEMR